MESDRKSKCGVIQKRGNGNGNDKANGGWSERCSYFGETGIERDRDREREDRVGEGDEKRGREIAWERDGER